MRSVWMGHDWSNCQYLNVLGESGTDFAKYCRKAMSGRKFVCAIKSLFNAMGLQLEGMRVLHCLCLFFYMTGRQ